MRLRERFAKLETKTYCLEQAIATTWPPKKPPKFVPFEQRDQPPVRKMAAFRYECGCTFLMEWAGSPPQACPAHGNPRHL